MSETPQFHPEIEKALETSGENVGRVKDIELAHEIALKTNSGIESPFRDENRGVFDDTDKVMQDGELKHEIAKRAVVKEFEERASGHIASDALYGGITYTNDVKLDRGKKELNVPNLQKAAAEVSEDYNVLKRMAKRTQDERRAAK